MFENITTRDWIYMTSECVVGVFATLGNGLVLLAIYKTHALRTITNCFIGSLATADMLVGLVIPPTTILVFRGLPRNFHACVFINSLVVLITNISILNLAAVALERFIAIRYPFHYHRLLTIQRAMYVVVITWITAILVGLIPTMGWNKGSDNFTDCSFTKVIRYDYLVYFIFFGINIPPLLFMFVIYLYIYHTIRKHRRRSVSQVRVLPPGMRRSIHQRAKEVRGAQCLAYVIILFAICWVPLHILNCISHFAPEKSPHPNVLLVTIVLSHANSCVNPFFYAYGNTKFKQAMKKILLCGRLDPTPNSDSLPTDGQSYRRSVFNKDNATPFDGKDQSHNRQLELFSSDDTNVLQQVSPSAWHLDVQGEPRGRLNGGFDDKDSAIAIQPPNERRMNKSVSWNDESVSHDKLPTTAPSRQDINDDIGDNIDNPHSSVLPPVGSKVSAMSENEHTSLDPLPIMIPLTKSLVTALESPRHLASCESSGTAQPDLSPPQVRRRSFQTPSQPHLDKVHPLYPQRLNAGDPGIPVKQFLCGLSEDYGQVVMNLCSTDDADTEYDETSGGPVDDSHHHNVYVEQAHSTNSSDPPEGILRAASPSPPMLFHKVRLKVPPDTEHNIDISSPSENSCKNSSDEVTSVKSFSENEDIFGSKSFISIRL